MEEATMKWLRVENRRPEKEHEVALDRSPRWCSG
jgi:hypothetical protein